MAAATAKDIGERIKEARQASEMTQRALADRLGVTDAIVNMWERGKRRPTLDNLIHIASVLLIDPATLLTGMVPEARFTAIVTDDDELDLLRSYRRMLPKTRENVRRLIGITADISADIEAQREPA